MKTVKELALTLQQHRKSKGLEQKDMRMKIGMSQQQYQRAEAGNDLRVSTLLRILEGLNLELEFVPRRPFGQESDHPLTKDTENTNWKEFLDDLED